jgi:Flp pilus assembly CpaE family ATPase
LFSLAAVARGGLDEDAVWPHAQQLPGGVRVLVGPASGDEAHAVLRDVVGLLAGWAAAQSEVDIIVDCGRIAPGSPTIEVLAKADEAMMLARPSLDQLRPAAHRLVALGATGATASLLLVGDSPYGPDEVVATLDADVVGVIAWDPRTAATLTGTRRAVGDLRRSPLVRSAATLAERLASAPSAANGSNTTKYQPLNRDVEVAEGVSG